LKRLFVARWILSTLLGAFLISTFLFYGLPFIGVNVASYGALNLYGTMVIAKSTADVIAYLLVTPPWAKKEM